MLDENITLKQEKEAYIVVRADQEGNVDDFIYDTILVGLYDEYNYFRLISCLPLSLHTMVWPIQKN